MIVPPQNIVKFSKGDTGSSNYVTASFINFGITGYGTTQVSEIHTESERLAVYQDISSINFTDWYRDSVFFMVIFKLNFNAHFTNRSTSINEYNSSTLKVECGKK